MLSHPQLLRLLGLCVLLFSLHPRAAAHLANQSYVYFSIFQDRIEGTVHVSAADLNKLPGLRLPTPLSEDVLAPHLPRILSYLTDHLVVRSAGEVQVKRFTEGVELLNLDDRMVLKLPFLLEGVVPVPGEIEVGFDPFMDIDDTHRTFALIEYNWKAGIHANESGISLRFSPGDRGPKVLDLTDGSTWTGFRAMVVSGMYHIYIGMDHILFLLALLLPAVLIRRKTRLTLGATGGVAVLAPPDPVWRSSKWQPVSYFRPAFLYVLKIVTCFTVAHTITLSLAALGLVELPGYLVESLIALSIALAALHNLYPLFRNDGMLIAFVFGLFHGFGFASVLGQVGLRGEYMSLSLLGFNVGVELAQVVIICLAFPVLFFLRRTLLYRYLLSTASVLLICIGLYWFTERFFGVDIPGWRLILGPS